MLTYKQILMDFYRWYMDNNDPAHTFKFHDHESIVDDYLKGLAEHEQRQAEHYDEQCANREEYT